MKYINQTVLAMAVSAMGLTACGDFGDMNVNPNYPSESTTYAQFLFSSRYVKYFVCNSYYYDIWSQQYPGYLSESKNNQYGPLDCTTQFQSDHFYYYAIRTLNEIIEQNEDESKSSAYVLAWGPKENQIAIARTLRAFFYMSITDIIGPTPYLEALQGSKGNWTPAYDNTDVIYSGLDADLCEAYDMFDESVNMAAAEYDIFYGGNIKRWKRFNATLRMMMAIKMKDVDPVQGKARFAAAYADGGMVDYQDSFTYTYDNNNSSTMNFAPMYSTAYNIDNGNQNHVPNKVIVDSLKHYQDPRLFTYCNVTASAYKGKAGAYGPNDFRSYRGVPFGLSSNAEVAAQSKYCCSVGDKYCAQTATYGVITAARALLVMAEAAQLGWISADVETLYNDGIRASFEFEAELEKVNVGGSFEYDLAAYMAQDKVKLSANPEQRLRQIWLQRWLAGYLTDGVEAWADWRINNYPELPVYQGQLDNNHATFPYRLCYTDNDCSLNPECSAAAITDYLQGKDDRYVRIWWDVKDNTSPVGVLETSEEIEAYKPE
ncbi:MAG: SusD/RagB family nutrient-binding outer membrane lipoprotein [Bacteroidales bacterium]|nr:SusD/RagB family nutrient-binding outer membrane lipoprotein [Bacteroidales bacterium]